MYLRAIWGHKWLKKTYEGVEASRFLRRVYDGAYTVGSWSSGFRA